MLSQEFQGGGDHPETVPLSRQISRGAFLGAVLCCTVDYIGAVLEHPMHQQVDDDTEAKQKFDAIPDRRLEAHAEPRNRVKRKVDSEDDLPHIDWSMEGQTIFLTIDGHRFRASPDLPKECTITSVKIGPKETVIRCEYQTTMGIGFLSSNVHANASITIDTAVPRNLDAKVRQHADIPHLMNIFFSVQPDHDQNSMQKAAIAGAQAMMPNPVPFLFIPDNPREKTLMTRN